MNAKDLERYRQLLLAKRHEIEAGAIGTMGATGGTRERPADVADQATDAAQADLQAHLHQTDSHLLRAIEEARPRAWPKEIQQGCAPMGEKGRADNTSQGVSAWDEPCIRPATRQC